MIRALLEENSVIITGLGTFILKKLTSQIKEDVVYPPQNIIEFEYSKDIEGFHFVSKLSQWEQIRIDEAQAKISEWLNLLEQGVEHNKSLFFDNFGTFSKATSGKIVFQSMLIPELNVENEGFAPVFLHTKEIKQEHQSKDEVVIDKRIVYSEKKKKKKRDILWFSVTICATALLLVTLFFKDTIVHYYHTVLSKGEVTAMFEDDETEHSAYISNVKVKDTPVVVHENVMKKEVSSSPTVSKENLEKEVMPISSSHSNDLYLSYQTEKYYVIAGSFTKEEDALRHIRQKKLEKYDAKILLQPQNSRLRVCIGVFDNEKDAEKFAAQIDKNYWVLK
jgi:nucleoid DNA-binding protein